MDITREKLKRISRLIWIDPRAKAVENKSDLRYLKLNTKAKKIICVTSVNDAAEYIESRTDLKRGGSACRAYLVIVSEKLAREFFVFYAENTVCLRFVCYTSVLCSDPAKLCREVWFRDPFLNPGGAHSRVQDIAEDFSMPTNENWVQLEWTLESAAVIKGPGPAKDLENENDYSFYPLENAMMLFLPFYLPQTLSKADISYDMLYNFLWMVSEKLASSASFSAAYRLLNPLREKDAMLPPEVLATFWLNLYTYENGGFHKVINDEFRKGHYDFVSTFLLTLVTTMKGKRRYQGDLYRISRLSKTELDNLRRLVSKPAKEEAKGDLPNIYKEYRGFVHANTFLSFSKNKEDAEVFASCVDDLDVMFVLDSRKEADEPECIFSLDISDLSVFEGEQEVLVLPYCPFIVTSVVPIRLNGYKAQEVHLSYIGKQYKELENYYKNPAIAKSMECDINLCFDDIMNFEFSKKIAALFPYIELREKLSRIFRDKIGIQDIGCIHAEILPPIALAPQQVPANWHPAPSNPVYYSPQELADLFKKRPNAVYLTRREFVRNNGKIEVKYGLIAEYADGPNVLMYDSCPKNRFLTSVPKCDKVGGPGYSNHWEKVEKIVDCSSLDTSQLERFKSLNIRAIRELNLLQSPYYNVGYSLGFLLLTLLEERHIISKHPEACAQGVAFGLLPNAAGLVVYKCDLSAFTRKLITKTMDILTVGYAVYSLGSEALEMRRSGATAKELAWRLASTGTQIVIQGVISYGGAILGAKIGAACGCSGGPIGLVLGAGVGLLAGLLFRRVTNKIGRAIEVKFALTCEGTYGPYVPAVLRSDQSSPRLSWEGCAPGTTGFCVVMIENDTDIIWELRNVDNRCREIPFGENQGDVIVPYKGISDGAEKIAIYIYAVNCVLSNKASFHSISKDIQEHCVNFSEYKLDVL